jgi:hypothetical protein
MPDRLVMAASLIDEAMDLLDRADTLIASVCKDLETLGPDAPAEGGEPDHDPSGDQDDRARQ